jgi:hypothetical protein
MTEHKYPSDPRLLPNGEGVVCDQCHQRWDPAKGEGPNCTPCAKAWEQIEEAQNMTDTFTKITVPGQHKFTGIMDHGRQTTEDMIKMARAYAAHMRACADAIDAAADDNFKVEIVRGSVVQTLVKVLQEGRPVFSTMEELRTKAGEIELAAVNYLAADGTIASSRPVSRGEFIFIDADKLVLTADEMARKEFNDIQFKLRPAENHS